MATTYDVFIGLNNVWTPAELRVPERTTGMPTANSTGGTGVARTTSTATTVTEGATYNNINFTASAGVNISNIDVVTFNNCKFRRILLGDTKTKTRVFNDCEGDGQQYLDGAIVFGVGATFNRCKLWNAAQGIAGHTITFEDGWIGDLWGAAATHSEAILIGHPGGGAAKDFHVRRSTPLGNYRAGAPGAGMSGAIACYNHNDGGFAWGPQSGHIIENNWLQSLGTTAGYTVFFSTPGGTLNMSNCVLRNNTFLRGGPGQTSAPNGIADIGQPSFAGGTDNVISGNKYDSGENLGSPNVVATGNTSSPFYGRLLAPNPHNQAKVWTDANPTHSYRALIAEKISGEPIAQWAYATTMGGQNAYDWANQRRTEHGNKVGVIVLYNIPVRDLNSYAAGGASNATEYRTWIDNIISGLAGRPTVILYEPDALTHSTATSSAQKTERYTLMRESIIKLKNAGHHVYVDAGHPRWKTVSELVALLREINAENARGFCLNVSNFLTTEENQNYGDQVSALFEQQTGKKIYFLVGTSRNGNGPAPDGKYLNPLGRALGDRQGATPSSVLCDAYIWVKGPGESDANDGTTEFDGSVAPGSGGFWPAYAYGLAQRAKWGTQPPPPATESIVYQQPQATDGWSAKANATAPAWDSASSSLQWTAPGATSTDIQGPGSLTQIQVNETDVFTFGYGELFHTSAGVLYFNVAAQFFDVNQGYIGSSERYSVARDVAPNQWVTLNSLKIGPGFQGMPTGARYARIFVNTGDTVTAGATFRLRGMKVTK